jgi:hypothetical protein
MTSRALWIIAVVGFALPFLLAPWLNFALGRYEARSLIALSLLLFGAAFMAAARTPQNDGSVSSRTGSALRISVAVALATIVGADLVFLSMWREALGGVKAVTTSATDDTAGMAFVSVAEGGPALSDRQRRALVHLGFGWTWPLLSIDIAPGYRPQAVLFDPAKTDTACRRKEAFLSPQNSLIPEQVRLQLVTFSCAHPPPPRPATKSERFFSKLRTLFQ